MQPSDREHVAGGVAAALGVALLFLGTWLHPMRADPNDPRAAFTEYAADRLWVASHLLQLVGMLLMIAALLIVAKLLAGGPSAAWARIGRAGATAGIALSAALQAVDGVALKVMVNAWAAAPEGARSELFYSAFAVRQIEAGLASMLSLVLGLTVVVYGIALRGDARFGGAVGWLGIAGGVPTACAGVLMATTGFSDATMIVNMPANLLLLVWMLWLGLKLSRVTAASGAEFPS